MSTLAAARADNFYYPPGWTPQKGSLNKYHGQHALRERAKKIHEGILVIRFEMPFHVWCGGCQSMIGKGVRFNAEKKQVGNYHSTKIWSFTMKSACCQHEIEIRTDPKACDYVVVRGAERKVVEYDAEDAQTLLLPSEEDRQRLREDPLLRMEHQRADRQRAAEQRGSLAALKASADARHADPMRLNRQLRGQLRAQKRRVAAEEAEARGRGLGIRLLPAAEADSAAAATVEFKPHFERNRRESRAAIRAQSIFAKGGTATGGKEGTESKEGGKRKRREEGRGSGVRGHAGQGGSAGRELLLSKRRRIDAAGAVALTRGLASTTRALA